MKNWLAGVLLFFCSNAMAQDIISHQIVDDGFVEVPLQFAFPYYGQLFTNSWMFDNGVVGFYSPILGYNGGQNYFSQSFSSQLPNQFSFMIAPFWTDLNNYSGTFTTQGDSSFQRYTWNNISQWGYPDNLNSFSLEILPSGSINVQYDQINITGFPVSVGTTGNLEKSEFQQIFYALPETATNSVSDWGLFVPDPIIEEPIIEDPCVLDPLYSTDCAGYSTAYTLENLMNKNKELFEEEPFNEVEVIEILDSTEIVSGEIEQLLIEKTDTGSNSSLVIAKIIDNLTESSTSVVSNNVLLTNDIMNSDNQESELSSEFVEQAQVEVTNAVNSNTTTSFANNMQQMLVMGSSITQILNTPVPDFSRFDIKNPSQEEQVQSAKIESQLEKMNEDEIEDQAALLVGSMDSNVQAMVVQLIGYKAGFDQYGGALTDQNNWYQSVSVYDNNRLPLGSNLLFGSQDQKHQELMSLQYRR